MRGPLVNDQRQADSDVISQLDFSKYRTPELVQSIREVIGVADKVGQVAIWSLIGTLIFVGGTAVLAFKTLPLLAILVVLGYALPAGWCVGVLVGMAEMTRRSADGILKVVDLLIEETAIVFDDVRDLASGDQQLPSPGALIDSVYHHLIFPIVRDIILDAGILGRPVLWFYRSTLDRAVKIAIRKYASDQFTETEQADLDLEVKQLAGDVAAETADKEDKIRSVLRSTRLAIASVGGVLKLMIVVPAYVVCLCGLGFSLLPIALTWLLFAVGPEPGAPPLPGIPAAEVNAQYLTADDHVTQSRRRTPSPWSHGMKGSQTPASRASDNHVVHPSPRKHVT